MNKNLLALLIASSLGLYGCGDESSLEGKATIDPDIEKSLKAETKINFDLLSTEKEVVTPSFLAVDSYDGTLATDGSNLLSNGQPDPAYSTNIADPKIALGKNDGWGTLEPITIEFKGKALTETPDPKSFVIIESFNPTSQTDTTTPAALTYGTDYIVTTAGQSLIVSLLKPLKANSNYMFAVTDALLDESNNSVGTSNSYAVLKVSNPPPSEALIPAQKIIHATEKTIEATTGTLQKDIVYSTWFTTASAGDALYAAKAAIALSVGSVVETGNASAIWGTDIDTQGMFSFVKPELDASYTMPGVTKYTGTVKLPYFLASNEDLTALLSQPWQSATPSLAKILNVINRNDATSAILLAQLTSNDIGITPDQLTTLVNDPNDNTTKLAVIQKLINKKLYLDEAKTQQLDAERLITKYSPAPQLRSVANVPYNLYMPGPGANCSDVNNIPVNIFGHGFTSDNNSADYYAGKTLDTNCQALIAIDLPLHGERWDPAFNEKITQEIAYMNLAVLPVARDNIRQSVADQMSLRASLGVMFGAKDKFTQAGIEPTYGELSKLSLINNGKPGVGYVGISLGGIVGIGYTATMNKPVLDDLATEAGLFSITRSHFDVPGGGIAYFLFNSEAFSGTIKAALKASDGYTAFKASTCSELDDASCDSVFFNTFAYAAQSVLDTTDPANLLGSIQTPVYLSMAQGDTVIPNGPFLAQEDVLKSAVAGTIPMIVNNSYEILSGPPTEGNNRSAALYKKEYSFHGALAKQPLGPLAPFASAIADMQANSISFLSNGSLPMAEQSFIYQIN